MMLISQIFTGVVQERDTKCINFQISIVFLELSNNSLLFQFATNKSPNLFTPIFFIFC